MEYEYSLWAPGLVTPIWSRSFPAPSDNAAQTEAKLLLHNQLAVTGADPRSWIEVRRSGEQTILGRWSLEGADLHWSD